MKKQILKRVIPAIKYSTLSKKINVSKEKKNYTKKEEKEWNEFFNKVSNVYFIKINF